MSKIKLNLIAFLVLVVFSISTNAQTSAFTYQGSLNDGANAANGTYQMRFSLFNAQTGGNPVGSPVEIASVQVTNGVFSVSLDFGAAAFDGSNRFIQVEVRRNSGETYVPLSPREQVKSVPYSVRSATSGNADQLGGVSSSQYVTSSSNAFIQNGSNVQPNSNFNISGFGLAFGFSASDGFYMPVGFGSGRILNRTDSSNLMVGFGSGGENSTGTGNTTVGEDSGFSFTSGSRNTFVGESAGYNSTTGTENTFIGNQAGFNNTSGNFNTFVGTKSGFANTIGSFNTTLGTTANLGGTNLSFATAIGSGSFVSTSSTIQLGRAADRTNVSGKFNVLNGRSSPVERGNVNLMTNTGNLNMYMQGGGDGNGINFGVNSPATGDATLFISQYNGVSYQDRFVINTNGGVEIRQLGSAGSTALCRNASNEISTCSSSLRYKSNIQTFSGGLSFIDRLRPISFDWKDGGMNDVGFGAEDVAKLDPTFVTFNDKGEVEGVKYDRFSVLFVNAFKEQQTQIEEQNKQIENQQKQIDELKQIVCSLKPEAEVCQKEENK